MSASLVSRHRSDVVGCVQPSERSARRIACPYRAVLASDATPRCAPMASADRQMIGDATLAVHLYCLRCAFAFTNDGEMGNGITGRAPQCRRGQCGRPRW
ncbi:hypothetical protein D8B32_17095, partial [Verminephrobacter eiseniae]|nr:hypothetical protein [Verminephrobacter eiseniae]